MRRILGPDGMPYRKRNPVRKAADRAITGAYQMGNQGREYLGEAGQSVGNQARRGMDAAGKQVDKAVESVSNADLNALLDYFSGQSTKEEVIAQSRNALDFMPQTANRLAGSQVGGFAARALPATAAVAAVLGLGDVVLGGESFANDGMDLLGMGAGMYGMHRGRLGGTTSAGRALQYTSGAVGGKITSDILQAVLGGGAPSQEQAALAQALSELQGRN